MEQLNITNHNTLDNRTTTNNTTNNHNSITSIQNTQNIHLNNFGEENMEALPNTFMTHMVKYPFTAIPSIIKKNILIPLSGKYEYSHFKQKR